ncbi:50S ribosomal protein L23 [Candidatus Pacearchaeota archaeon]|nr:50S ribosomal protein L23 [Candidatus Pacearchaeota archaeon]
MKQKEPKMEGTMLKPVMTEKAVMMIERDNMLTFETSMKKEKDEIRKEIENIFGIKVKTIRTLIRNNKKYARIKLGGDTLAIDIATKLGLM